MRTHHRIKLLRSASLYKTALNKQEVASFLSKKTDKISFESIKLVTAKSLGGKDVGLELQKILSSMNITIAKIIRELCSSIKNLTDTNKKDTSIKQVDEEIQKVIDRLVPLDSSQTLTTPYVIESSFKKEIRMIKLAYFYIVKQSEKISEEDLEKARRPVNTFLKKFYSLVFKVALAEEKYPAFSKYKSSGPLSEKPSSSSKDEPGLWSKITHSAPCIPIQTKFKPAAGQDRLIENWRADGVTKDIEDIKNNLKKWAVQVYPTIDKVALNSIKVAEESSDTKGSQSLNELAKDIFYYNLYIEHLPYVFIPPKYKSKKEVVDCFIDKVAEVSTMKDIPQDKSSAVPSIPSKEEDAVAVKSEKKPSVKSEEDKSPTKPPTKQSPKTYPIVIADKWQSQMNAEQKEMLSKLTPDEQKKVEDHLDHMSLGKKFKILRMNDQEKLAYFKQKVREELTEDAYQRVNS